jgi:hypothetical protein
MTSQALPSPLRVTTRRRTIVVALVAAIAGAAVAAALLLGVGSSDAPSVAQSKQLRGQGFALAYPAGWTPLSAQELARAKGAQSAVLRKGDGTGTVVVRRKPAPEDQSLRALTSDLTKGLERRFPDFRFISARVVPIRGGKAFLYTFTRTEAKIAQSIALIRVGKANFTIDALARTGETRTAREVAAIVRSFGP